MVKDEIAFTISKHARRRMRQRGVELEHIQRALQHPDRNEPDPEDADLVHAMKRLYRPGGSVCLRVVYNQSAIPWRVVTAFFDQQGGRRTT